MLPSMLPLAARHSYPGTHSWHPVTSKLLVKNELGAPWQLVQGAKGLLAPHSPLGVPSQQQSPMPLLSPVALGHCPHTLLATSSPCPLLQLWEAFQCPVLGLVPVRQSWCQLPISAEGVRSKEAQRWHSELAQWWQVTQHQWLDSADREAVPAEPARDTAWQRAFEQGIDGFQ